MKRFSFFTGMLLLSLTALAQFTIYNIYNISNSQLPDNTCWFINNDPSGNIWVGYRFSIM